MARVLSVNVATARPIAAKSGHTGIDKRPVEGPVVVRAPGPKGEGPGSGLVGDVICDRENHGGDDQAVYAYAREDLGWWESRLDEPLSCGHFGENLTTVGLDVNGALIGETWAVGEALVLQVTNPRIPCVTFQTWMDRRAWIKDFTLAGRPGAYLRVLVEGQVQTGDAIKVTRPHSHEVTVAMAFRALTRDPDLLPDILAAGKFLTAEIRQRGLTRAPFYTPDAL